jgi:general secretion pathway protein I
MARERGMTLIEVMIALAIAALALGALLRTVGGGITSTHTAGKYEEAVSRARSHMAALGRDAGLSAGESSGDDGSGFRWRLKVEPVAVSAAPPPVRGATAEQAGPAASVALFSVEVGIGWTADGRDREVVLRSQRLGPAATR